MDCRHPTTSSGPLAQPDPLPQPLGAVFHNLEDLRDQTIGAELSVGLGHASGGMRPAAEVVDRLEPDAGQVVPADLFLGDLQSSDSPAVDRDNVLDIRRLQTMVPGAVQEPRVGRSSLGRYSESGSP